MTVPTEKQIEAAAEAIWNRGGVGLTWEEAKRSEDGLAEWAVEYAEAALSAALAVEAGAEAFPACILTSDGKSHLEMFFKTEEDTQRAIDLIELVLFDQVVLTPASSATPCTCHPDDNPPEPCAGKYAYSECVSALTPASSAVEGEAVATGLMNGPLEEMAGYAPELFAERDQADWWLVRTDMGKVIFHGPGKARADRVAAIHGRTAEPLWSHPAPTPAVDAHRLANELGMAASLLETLAEDLPADDVSGIMMRTMAERNRAALSASPAPHQEGRADG